MTHWATPFCPRCYVFWHSLSLAALIGVFVMLQAYVYPFTAMVVK